MASYITEQIRKVPVSGSYDVVVVGGGIAGVAAAVSAARNGASVILIEKQVAFGGLATIGNVIVYLPLCDGNGRQVIKGLGEELLKVSVNDGFEEIPACWKRGGDKAKRSEHRYRVRFNPASYMLALETMVLKAGVKILYDCRFCDVAKTGKRISSVIVENKSGRQAIKCKTVIDASGDADVCFAAGEDTQSLDTNVRAGWYYSYDGKDLNVQVLHQPFDPYCKPTAGGRYRGDDVESVTQQIIDSRVMIRKQLKDLNKKAKPGTVVRPAILPLMADLRMTRRIVGSFDMTEADDGVVYDDSVGLTGDWRKSGPVWSFPYRSLIGVKTPNLAVAGRCISADTTIWDVTRVIPGCAVSGQAVGTAAAMACADCGGNLSKLKVELLQKQLKADKVILGL